MKNRINDQSETKTEDYSVDETVSVIVYPSGGYYIAQCLEYDIAAQASTVGVLIERFKSTFIGHAMLAMEHGEKPFETLGRAPSYAFYRFETAKKSPNCIKYIIDLKIKQIIKPASERETVFSPRPRMANLVVA